MKKEVDLLAVIAANLDCILSLSLSGSLAFVFECLAFVVGGFYFKSRTKKGTNTTRGVKRDGGNSLERSL